MSVIKLPAAQGHVHFHQKVIVRKVMMLQNVLLSKELNYIPLPLNDEITSRRLILHGYSIDQMKQFI